MNKQDAAPIRSYTEVERRLKGVFSDINKAHTTIVQINNELASIIQSLLINLSDYMNQGEFALWFYSGIPTLLNEPYINWTTPSDHEGDLYYNRTGGTVYQFTGQGWEQIDDDTLVETMALTNAEMADGDHERKIFLTEPTPPYEKGDWWIKENGTLYICQTDSSTTFSESDFLISSLYSLTLATQTVNTINIIRGEINQIITDYASILSLITPGNNIVAGENVNTATQSTKKDFELLQNALTIIGDTDIYKYHFNNQESTDPKYIGFVLDSNHNYSSDIVIYDSQNNPIGIDLFSVVSILWQGIKELQDEIDNL